MRIGHVGFTGTQKGWTLRQRDATIDVLLKLRASGFLWMHNGDCIGADKLAYFIWINSGGKVFGHVPDNDDKRFFGIYNEEADPKPYLERNKEIVQASDIVVGTPGERTEVTRSGTWATLRYCKKIGRPRILVFPSGEVERLPGTEL
jgi:hypothetical protein